MKNKKGFTLVEVLTVIAILAILALLILPNFIESLKKSKVSAMITQENEVVDAAKLFIEDYCKHPLINNKGKCSAYSLVTSNANKKYTCLNVIQMTKYMDDIIFQGQMCYGFIIYNKDYSSYKTYLKCGNGYETKKVDEFKDAYGDKIIDICMQDATPYVPVTPPTPADPSDPTLGGNYLIINTNTEYNTLKEAFDEVENNQIIKVLQNVNETTDATLNSSKTGVKLDLNGKTISFNSSYITLAGSIDIYSSNSQGIIQGGKDYTIVNNGTLSFNSSSENKVTIHSYSNPYGVINNQSSGTLTINKNTEIITDYNKTIANYGTLTINEGVLTSTAGESLTNFGTINITNGTINGKSSAINNQSSGTITISGNNSKLISETNYALQNNGGNCTINNGEIKGISGIINSGTLNINDGNITATGNVNSSIWNDGGTLTIIKGTIRGLFRGIDINAGTLTLGTNDSSVSKTSPVIEATGTTDSYGLYLRNSSGSLNFYDGIIKSSSGTNKSIYNAFSQTNVPNNYAIKRELNNNIESAYLNKLVAPTLNLTPKTAEFTGSVINANNATATYNGNNVSLTYTYKYYTDTDCSIETTTSTGASASGSAPKNAGNYYVKAISNATNEYSSVSSSCVSHTITKYTPKITLSATTGTTDVDQAGSFTAIPTTINSCKGTLKATSADANKVNLSTSSSGSFSSNASYSSAASASAKSFYFKGIAVSSGTNVNVEYIPTNTVNCNSSTKSTFNVTVNGLVPTINIASKTATYSGSTISSNAATATYNGSSISSLTYTYTYYTNSNCTTKTTTSNGASGEGKAPKNAGQYHVKATNNATATYASTTSNCASLKINKYKPTLSLSETSGSVIEGNHEPFTATPKTITSCKGDIVATSASSTYVSVSTTDSGTYAASATHTGVTSNTSKEFYYKGVKGTEGTNISVVYKPTDTANCNNSDTLTYNAIVYNSYWSNGSKYYRTLASAVSDASAGNTIKATKKHTDSSDVTISKNLTINTNGFTITRNKVITSSSGNLTVNGGGTISSASTIHLITNTAGNLTIKNVTLKNTSREDNTQVVVNSSSGTMTIENTTIESGYSCIENEGSGTTTVKSGTFTSVNSTVWNVANGTVNIEDGTYTTTESHSCTGGSGKINISGGMIRNTSSTFDSSAWPYALFVWTGGEANISGGEFSSNYAVIGLRKKEGTTAAGKATITAGNIHNNCSTANKCMAINANGPVVIGNSSNSVSTTSPIIRTSHATAIVIDRDAGGSMAWYDGSITAKTAAYNGSITLPSGYKATSTADGSLKKFYLVRN